MNAKEIAEQKKIFESDLWNMVKEFNKETGATITEIYLPLNRLQQIGVAGEILDVGGPTIRVEIS